MQVAQVVKNRAIDTVLFEDAQIQHKLSGGKKKLNSRKSVAFFDNWEKIMTRGEVLNCEIETNLRCERELLSKTKFFQ